MDEILEKLKEVSKKISDIKGPFVFFGLFKRNAPENKWDIVISAYWFSKKEDDLVLFIETLKSVFGDNNIDFLETIQMVSPDDVFIKEFIKTSEGKTLPSEFKDCQIQNIIFADFYVIENNSNIIENSAQAETSNIPPQQ